MKTSHIHKHKMAAAWAARHRQAPTAPVHVKIDEDVIKQVDAAVRRELEQGAPPLTTNRSRWLEQAARERLGRDDAP